MVQTGARSANRGMWKTSLSDRPEFAFISGAMVGFWLNGGRLARADLLHVERLSMPGKRRGRKRDGWMPQVAAG